MLLALYSLLANFAASFELIDVAPCHFPEGVKNDNMPGATLNRGACPRFYIATKHINGGAYLGAVHVVHITNNIFTQGQTLHIFHCFGSGGKRLPVDVANPSKFETATVADKVSRKHVDDILEGHSCW